MAGVFLLYAAFGGPQGPVEEAGWSVRVTGFAAVGASLGGISGGAWRASGRAMFAGGILRAILAGAVGVVATRQPNGVIYSFLGALFMALYETSRRSSRSSGKAGRGSMKERVQHDGGRIDRVARSTGRKPARRGEVTWEESFDHRIRGIVRDECGRPLAIRRDGVCFNLSRCSVGPDSLPGTQACSVYLCPPCHKPPAPPRFPRVRATSHNRQTTGTGSQKNGLKRCTSTGRKVGRTPRSGVRPTKMHGGNRWASLRSTSPLSRTRSQDARRGSSRSGVIRIGRCRPGPNLQPWTDRILYPTQKKATLLQA